MYTFQVTVFARAIIMLTPRMGKCRQSVPHVMMDSVFADIAEPWTPLFPGGERGRAGTQEGDKGWLTKPNQRSLLDGTMLTLLASDCESQCISSVTYESCDRKSKIKCVTFMKWGREGEKNFPVIRNNSHTCWGCTPAEIRWFKLLHRGVITAGAADKILNQTHTSPHTHTNRLPLNHLLLSGVANSNSNSGDTTALRSTQRYKKV